MSDYYDYYVYYYTVEPSIPAGSCPMPGTPEGALVEVEIDSDDPRIIAEYKASPGYPTGRDGRIHSLWIRTVSSRALARELQAEEDARLVRAQGRSIAPGEVFGR
jgi:hypothetical protein